MILKALYDYYHRCGDLAPQGKEWKEISFIIVVDADGNLLDVEDNRSDDKKHGLPHLVVKGVRSGTAPKPYLFWDNVEYTCNYIAPNPKSTPEEQAELQRKAALKHQALVERFKAISEKYPGNKAFRAVSLFYENGGLETLYAHHLWEDIKKKPTVNISYRFDNDMKIIAEDVDLNNEIDSVSDSESKGDKAVCIITGKPCEPVESSTPTPVPGSQATARLVSFQINSGYDSYGKQKGLNAPISREAEACYTTALNKLLGKGSPNKYVIGNRTFVFWGSSNSEATAIIENALGKELSDAYGDAAYPDEDVDDPNEKVEAVTKAFEAIYKGTVPGALTDRFYVLGLAPNAARVAVTHWSDSPLRDFASNILKHHEDMRIVDTRLKKWPYTGLYSILKSISVTGKASDIKSNLPEAILKSIVEGTPYPFPLMQQVILRIQADHKVDTVRAAIIKAYLNRIDKNKQNQITVMLNNDEKNIGYLCGRLFAVFEYTQRKASGISTVSDKYLSSAMSKPASVFPTLYGLTKHHLNKISRDGLRIYLEKIRQDIADKLPSTGYPAQLDLNDKGRFTIGYDHQMHYLYTHKEEERKAEENEDSKEQENND